MSKEIIYGVQAVREALEAARPIDKLLLRKGARNDAFTPIIAACKRQEIPWQFVPEIKLNKICPGRNHQGVVGFAASVVFQPLEEVLARVYEAGRAPFFCIADEISDVRNVGAIARSGSCFSLDALIVTMQGSARLGMDALKTSAGALNTLTVSRVRSAFHAAKLLRESGVYVVATSERAEQSIFDLDLTQPVAWVLGAENDGVSADALNAADALAAIPVGGPVASLNVSVAAGICFSETARQRGFSSE